MRKGIVEILLLALLIGVSVSFAYYYGTQNGKIKEPKAASITESPEVVNKVLSEIPSPTDILKTKLPDDWQTFTSQEYGFKISYPPSYKALTDKENLYGWPKAIVLIYSGGQSYDLPIEYWTSEAEYKSKYKNQTNLVVKKVGEFYITLVNVNSEPKVDQIIETFEIIL
jgi:hypothetical protein